MKKRYLIILAAMLLSVSSTAQVFMLDMDDKRSPEIGGMDITNPDIHNSGEDWAYVPVGRGALLLAGLASAYLVGKKKKK